MSALLELVPRWVLAAMVAALVALSGWLYVGLGAANLKLADSRAEVAVLKVEIAEANTKAAEQKAELASQVLKAQNEAKKRENILRSGAAAAATESDGLRNDLASMRDQYDKLSRDAVIERAAAVGIVLADCTRKYQGMAETAGRHASDVRTLIDAWPKSPAPV